MGSSPSKTITTSSMVSKIVADVMFEMQSSIGQTTSVEQTINVSGD